MFGSIYEITNCVNGKSYIGKTYKTIDARLQEHKRDSRKEHRSHRPLYRAMRKYGENNFVIKLLEFTENLEDREIYWINLHNVYKDGYNATIGGDGRPWVEINEEELINKYSSGKTIKELSEYYGHDQETISKRLKGKVIIRKGLGKPIAMFNNKGFYKEFSQQMECAEYLLRNNLTTTSRNRASSGISRALTGLRKTYLKYNFKYL